MKYFLDAEFIEGFREYRVNVLKKRQAHFIDLISIGIVCEDGRTYYAVSTEFNPNDANDWVKRNVLQKLPARHAEIYDAPRLRQEAMLWKDLRTIRQDIMKFFGYTIQERHPETGQVVDMSPDEKIEVWGYYADYDWVAFCSLFGRMIDLPYNMPMYCRDLKQLMDEKGLDKAWKDSFCPEPELEHNALEDAKWNQHLYDEIHKSLLISDL